MLKKEVELLYHQKVEFQIDHLVHRSKQSAKGKASVSLVKTKKDVLSDNEIKCILAPKNISIFAPETFNKKIYLT